MFTLMLLFKGLSYLCTACFLFVGIFGILSLYQVYKTKDWNDTPTMIAFLFIGIIFLFAIYTWKEEGHKRAIFWGEESLKQGPIYTVFGEPPAAYQVKTGWREDETFRFPVWLVEEGSQLPQPYGLKTRPIYRHFVVRKDIRGQFEFCDATPPVD